MRKYLFFLLTGLFLMEACHKGAPPLDWDNFDAAHIDRSLSKKDPFNNYSIIFWQSTKGCYTRQKLANYAFVHGWRLAEIVRLDSLDARLYNGIVVGIVGTLFKPANKNKVQPDWFRNGVTLYKFGVPGQKVKKGFHKPYHSAELVSMDESSACVYPIMDDS